MYIYHRSPGRRALKSCKTRDGRGSSAKIIACAAFYARIPAGRAAAEKSSNVSSTVILNIWIFFMHESLRVGQLRRNHWTSVLQWFWIYWISFPTVIFFSMHDPWGLGSCGHTLTSQNYDAVCMDDFCEHDYFIHEFCIILVHYKWHANETCHMCRAVHNWLGFLHRMQRAITLELTFKDFSAVTRLKGIRA